VPGQSAQAAGRRDTATRGLGEQEYDAERGAQLQAAGLREGNGPNAHVAEK